jgi:predicted O-methyltransferase YrrM
MSVVDPGLILETGTYLGTTTELLAEFGLPIVTVESSTRNYAFARARLRRFRNVQLRLGDSRTEMLRALDRHSTTPKGRPVFAYLDAHWNVDLPLAEELEVVFAHCPNAVVMVDDFRVPDDPGYGYDNFGSGKAIDQSYIAPAVGTYGLAVLYPVLPSAQETGQRRGCAVLANEADWAHRLLATGLLRRA